MINIDKLKGVIAVYKQDFTTKQWADEKYKWEAVQHFQHHWNINAPDFASMFMTATDRSLNLLASMNNFPRGMIKAFAEADPEATRAMFIHLFDEDRQMVERISKFQSDSDVLREKYDDGSWKQHYQNPNSITTYLWLRYPDKYYIYKYSEVRIVAEELESTFKPKRGASETNVAGAFALYNEICDVVQQDAELTQMLRSVMTDTCYPDPQLKTLTVDVSFYISRYYSKHQQNTPAKWFPDDYTPGLTVEQWVGLLNDSSVFTQGSLEIMKRLKDYGGAATCKQLSVKYGEEPNFYNTGSSRLARRIAEKTNCPLLQKDTENSKWWPVLYVGRYADKEDTGSYIWKLRDELSAAIDQVDLSGVPLYVHTSPAIRKADHDADRISDAGQAAHGYWWLNANPKMWSFSDLAVDEAQSYTLYNDNGNKRRIFQNFLDARPGDPIICYESSPVKRIVALANVSKENDGASLYFVKTEGLPSPIEYSMLRSCPELEQMEYFAQPQGSLFKLTKGEYEFIMDIIREENPGPSSNKPKTEAYDKTGFLADVYMPGERYDALVSLLRRKQNVILQGAPGTGKTFAAKRLAYAMIGEKDDNRIEFIQFHQSYSYEDFIMGYKPQGEGFALQYGVFYRFCQKAANEPDKAFFFIIDEINRGNLSKIFGELLMLMEYEYRGAKATLAYDGRPFSVPKNLYMIGLMNTADRSLAMMDYALRRRFSFFDMEPAFASDGFLQYQQQLDHDTFNTLIDRIRDLNREILTDGALGKGFCIGHSYFCGQTECTDDWLKEVVEYDMLPMLGEYWFDEPAKAQKWENMLRGVFND